MYDIASLELWQFRNYAQLNWQDIGQINVLLGLNGAGKTNILEAIYFLSHGRSHRCARESEMVRSGRGGHLDASEHDDYALGQGTRITLKTKNGETLTAKILPQEGGGRYQTQFLKNDKRCASRSEILGMLPTVSFTLDDLDILRGAPKDRRRWLDLACSQVNPRHIHYLQTWKKVIDQKRALLKNATFPEPTEDEWALLDVVNSQLAEVAYPILKTRLETLDILNAALPDIYTTMSGDASEGIPLLRYNHGGWAESPLPTQLAQAAWTQAAQRHLSSLAVNEFRREAVVWGVHRDDVKIGFAEDDHHWVDATTYASQGQQRSIVVALKLAELQMLEATLPASPIILLDDVMAELDGERQRHLLEVFPQSAQVFLTTPELQVPPHVLEHLSHRGVDLSVWRVESGRLVRV